MIGPQFQIYFGHILPLKGNKCYKTGFPLIELATLILDYISPILHRIFTKMFRTALCNAGFPDSNYLQTVLRAQGIIRCVYIYMEVRLKSSLLY